MDNKQKSYNFEVEIPRLCEKARDAGLTGNDLTVDFIGTSVITFTTGVRYRDGAWKWEHESNPPSISTPLLVNVINEHGDSCQTTTNTVTATRLR